MNEKPSTLDRRSWIKLAGLGGATAVLGKAPAAQAAPTPTKPRGIVFLVSDGMSMGVLTLAEELSKKVRNGQGTAWWELLGKPATAQGLMETFSANSIVTDSAAAATAWGGGQRVNNGAINVKPDGSSLEPVMKTLKKAGAKTGLVTTATVTHATPAGFAAIQARRNDEHLIAPQYLNTVDVILGGGLKFFSPEGRADKHDLLADYKNAGYDTVTDKKSMLASKSERIIGLFHNDHLPYTLDQNHDEKIQAAVPTLAEMTERALTGFLAGDAPFLLQVEGARIDHAAHLNDIAGLLWDQIAFDDAVKKTLELTQGHADILVIVTSDHGNANPGLNGIGPGYSLSAEAFENVEKATCSFEFLMHHWRAEKEKTPQKLADLIEKKLGIPIKTAEAEALNHAFAGQPSIEWNHQLANPHGILGQISGNITGIGWTGTSHTADPTTICATGPGSETCQGILLNTDIHPILLEII